MDTAKGSPIKYTDWYSPSPHLLKHLEILDIYDNRRFRKQKNLIDSWGFSCVIKTDKKTILFDTGRHSLVLLNNMYRMGIAPREIDIIVLSHSDDDHSGGLHGFLEVNPHVELYLTDTYPDTDYESIQNMGIKITFVQKAIEIIPGVWTTGALPTNRVGSPHAGKKEQSIIFNTVRGPIVITGCAHADIISVSEKVEQLLKQSVYLLIGGFHYKNSSSEELERVLFHPAITRIPLLAPTHCSGELINKLILKEGSHTLLEFGLGKIWSTNINGANTSQKAFTNYPFPKKAIL